MHQCFNFILAPKANMWFQSFHLVIAHFLPFGTSSNMVFTRKRQAEDDAAQMDMIDAACSAAGPSGMSLPAAVTDNAVATSTEGISQSAPVRGQSTLSGKCKSSSCFTPCAILT